MSSRIYCDIFVYKRLIIRYMCVGLKYLILYK